MANFSGFSLANSLGVISPNISTVTVMTIVETVVASPASEVISLLKNTVLSDALRMLTMLLPTSMVESSLSNFSLSFNTASARLLPSCDMLRSLILLIDVKAISAPEK